MLTKRIIPCLDVRDGRVVKGVRFSGLRDAGSPAELAQRYEEEGADELVLLDISAGPEKRDTALATVEEVRSVISIPLTVGGGVRKVEDARALLQAGADKVSVNTAAFENPALLSELADSFGSQCTVLAIDAAVSEQGFSEVVILSGKRRTGKNVIDWAKQAVGLGIGEILLTSWDRDGTKSGYDLECLSAVSGAVSVPVIASGGAATPAHLLEAFQAGANAVLAASIFHEGTYRVSQIKSYLSEQGVSIRPC